MRQRCCERKSAGVGTIFFLAKGDGYLMNGVFLNDGNGRGSPASSDNYGEV